MQNIRAYRSRHRTRWRTCSASWPTRATSPRPRSSALRPGAGPSAPPHHLHDQIDHSNCLCCIANFQSIFRIRCVVFQQFFWSFGECGDIGISFIRIYEIMLRDLAGGSDVKRWIREWTHWKEQLLELLRSACGYGFAQGIFNELLQNYFFILDSWICATCIFSYEMDANVLKFANVWNYIRVIMKSLTHVENWSYTRKIRHWYSRKIASKDAGK